jgi:hypothetical protein
LIKRFINCFKFVFEEGGGEEENEEEVKFDFSEVEGDCDEDGVDV